MVLPPGARVRARIATSLVPRGLQGSVLGMWPTIPHAYDVRFDGQREPLLMWQDELECIEADSVVSEQSTAIRRWSCGGWFQRR
ncbi:MAG TPA: hypothetical protein VFO07_11740 [Roseiflexaceae bacterium]|nr:hypothetical protein [Roseiflexaceae bacterium]